MAISPTIASLEVFISTMTSSAGTTAQAWLSSLTINAVHGFSVIPISNTKAKLAILYT